MRNNFLIIGVGGIGFRHFESLNKLKNINLYLVDPKIKFIKKNKIKNEINQKNSYYYYKNIKSIQKKKYSLVIVSTNSNVRFNIFKFIIINKISKNIILEKIVFSKLSEYQNYKDILEKYKFNCWVNCLNRVFSISSQLKKKHKKTQPKKIIVSGNNWGLGCNFIHFLDLASYLSGNSNIKYVKTKIDKIINSKRKGFLEFHGKINIILNNLCEVSMQSKSGDTKYKLKIKYPGSTYVIDEINNKTHIFKKQRKIKLNLVTQRVSDLTSIYATKIIKKKSPGLVTLKKSLDLHYPIIEAICNELSIKKKKQILDCRIT